MQRAQSEAAPGAVLAGNAYRDRNGRHWLIGWFIQDPPLRSDTRVEIKWGDFTKGDRRTHWSKSDVATSLAILIRGKMRFLFEDREEHVLAEQGDYVLWPPDTLHAWEAIEDATVITVRWPSLAGHEIIREERP
jgi:quercetin dioxygenase-like cupin family protein